MYNTRSGVVTLDNIKFAARGTYHCVARNFVGSAKFSVTITVEGKY